MSLTCYDQKSIPRPEYFPCSDYTTEETASCCAAGDQCGRNGLCMVAAGTGAGNNADYYLRGCTNSDWSGCPKNCFSYHYGGVQGCPPGNQSFCCYGDYKNGEWPGRNNGCDCSNSTVVFSLPPAYPAMATIPASLKSSTTTSIPSTTGTSATTASADFDTGTSATTASPDFEPTQTSSSHTSRDSDLWTGLGIGLGVGIPLTLAATSIIWLWNRRQNRKEVALGPLPSTPVARLLRQDENEGRHHQDQRASELQEEGGPETLDYNEHKRRELDGSNASLSPQELHGDARL